jgi:hypothetical protein
MNYTDKSKRSNKLYCIMQYLQYYRSTFLGNIIYIPMPVYETAQQSQTSAVSCVMGEFVKISFRDNLG